MKIKNMICVGLIAASMGLVACDQQSDSSEQAAIQGSLEANAPAITNEPIVAAQPTTVMITHTKGQTAVPAQPKRVVVFDTALLDTLSVLGVSGDVIVAVPQPKIPFPAILQAYQDKKYVNAGTLQEPDFEKINELAPDLIFNSGRADRAYDELSRIAPTITLTADWTNFYPSLKEVTFTAAKLFDKEEEASSAVDKLDALIADTKTKASNAGTAVFIMINGGKMSAYGPGSRFGFIFDELGMEQAHNFTAAGAGTHGNVVSMEYLLETDPDWVFVLDRETAIGESASNAAAKQVLDNEIIRSTKAYQNNHIIYVDSPTLYIAGGLGAYTEFVQFVNDAISQ